jgi:hypothetical protein
LRVDVEALELDFLKIIRQHARNHTLPTVLVQRWETIFQVAVKASRRDPSGVIRGGMWIDQADPDSDFTEEVIAQVVFEATEEDAAAVLAKFRTPLVYRSEVKLYAKLRELCARSDLVVPPECVFPEDRLKMSNKSQFY